jgi:hypothetical protein
MKSHTYKQGKPMGMYGDSATQYGELEEKTNILFSPQVAIEHSNSQVTTPNILNELRSTW